MSTESYLELLAGLRAGDAEAKVKLSKRFFVRVLGLVRKKLWSPIRDQKDVEILDSILNSLVQHHGLDQAIDPENEESMWHLLAKVALRHCNKHNKRTRQEQERAPSVTSIGVPREGPGEEYHTGLDPIDDGPPPELAVEFADWLEALLKKLNPRQQKIFRWQLEGVPQKAMRDRLGVSGSTVEREVKSIRTLLTEEYEHLESL